MSDEAVTIEHRAGPAANRAECAAVWDEIWLLIWRFDIALPAGERAALLRDLARLAAAGASAAERETSDAHQA